MARDIAVAYRKHNLSMADALKGLNVTVQLADIGVLPEQIPSFVETVKKMCTDSGYTPSPIIQSAMELTDIEAQSGKKYPAAIEEFKTTVRLKKELSKENEELSEENERLQLQIEDNRRKCDESFRRTKTTQRKLTEFLHWQANYRRLGLDIEDAETVGKVLVNVNEARGDVGLLVSLAQTYDSVSKEVAYLEGERQTKHDEVTTLKSQVEAYTQILWEQQQQQKAQESIIDSYRNEIANYSSRLSQIQNNVTEFEKQIQGMILWICRKMGLSQEETQKMLLTSQYEISLATFDNALSQYQARLRANCYEALKAWISR